MTIIKDAEILTVAALYRDRADCENNFDELKHHSYRILSRALRKYLHGRELQPPDPLPAPT